MRWGHDSPILVILWWASLAGLTVCAVALATLPALVGLGVFR